MPFVRPARPKLLVPFPGQPKRYLREEGELVDDDRYWQRALARGDVVLAEPPKTVAGSESKSRSRDAQS